MLPIKIKAKVQTSQGGIENLLLASEDYYNFIVHCPPSAVYSLPSFYQLTIPPTTSNSDSLEKALMLGKIEDEQRRGWERMRS